MKYNRIKDIQSKTAYPDSISVLQALMQVRNEVSQELITKQILLFEDVLDSLEYIQINYPEVSGVRAECINKIKLLTKKL